MRAWAWAAVGVVLGYAASCGGTSAFACQSDADCILTGVPGICDTTGLCAYPDQACPSGFSYPVATPDVGGDCVPGSGAADGVTGGGDGGPDWGTGGDGDEDTTADSVDDGPVMTTADGTTSGGTTGSVTTMGAETNGGVSTGNDVDSGVSCSDEHGDEVFSATLLNGCEVNFESQIVDGSDVDWVGLIGPGADCPETEYTATLTGDEALLVCVFAGCEGGAATFVDCTGSSVPAMASGLQGCCDPEQASGVLGCPDTPEEDLDPFVLVTVGEGQGAPVCSPYTVDLVTQNGG
ncbi:MAG: hypothetical protein AAF721_28225 [Myxococcota bacterium]